MPISKRYLSRPSPMTYSIDPEIPAKDRLGVHRPMPPVAPQKSLERPRIVCALVGAGLVASVLGIFMVPISILMLTSAISFAVIYSVVYVS